MNERLQSDNRGTWNFLDSSGISVSVCHKGISVVRISEVSPSRKFFRGYFIDATN